MSERQDLLTGFADPRHRNQKLPAGVLPPGGDSDSWFPALNPQAPKLQNCRYLGESFFLLKLILILFSLFLSYI